jgi:hypothetical protein
MFSTHKVITVLAFNPPKVSFCLLLLIICENIAILLHVKDHQIIL